MLFGGLLLWTYYRILVWYCISAFQLCSKQREANDIADYDEGLIYYLRMHTTKSAFNPQYTMEMSSTTSIMNARTYCGIGVCGGRPYLKYYDDSTYNSISAMDGEL